MEIFFQRGSDLKFFLAIGSEKKKFTCEYERESCQKWLYKYNFSVMKKLMKCCDVEFIGKLLDVELVAQRKWRILRLTP